MKTTPLYNKTGEDADIDFYDTEVITALAGMLVRF